VWHWRAVLVAEEALARDSRDADSQPSTVAVCQD